MATALAAKRSQPINTRPKPRTQWLPPFCTLPTLFAVMIVAELVVLVVVLAPGVERALIVERLAIGSVYAQWLALLIVVVLCSLRDVLDRMRPWLGSLLAWLAIIATATLAAQAIRWIDLNLELGLTGPRNAGHPFVFATALLCALIGAALLRYLIVIERWRSRVEAASKAQVDALQARIRPHFLFNSMNTIISLIRTRPSEAERAVEDLSDLFRAALGSDQGMATLGDELDLVEQYLRIEQLRLGSRLSVQRELDDAPRALPMPRLLLQPLVENAVVHGIAKLPNGGVISLACRHEQRRVTLTVCNPCPTESSSSGSARGNDSGHNGHAIGNIRERIGYHYGDRASVETTPAAGAFVVTLTLPEPATSEH